MSSKQPLSSSSEQSSNNLVSLESLAEIVVILLSLFVIKEKLEDLNSEKFCKILSYGLTDDQIAELMVFITLLDIKDKNFFSAYKEIIQLVEKKQLTEASLWLFKINENLIEQIIDKETDYVNWVASKYKDKSPRPVERKIEYLARNGVINEFERAGLLVLKAYRDQAAHSLEQHINKVEYLNGFITGLTVSQKLYLHKENLSNSD